MKLVLVSVFSLLMYGFPYTAIAESEGEAAPQPGSETESDQEPSWITEAQRGPRDIALLDQAKLALPSTHVFIPQKAAADLLEEMGNTPGPDLIGVVAPADFDDAKYFITVRYAPEGYVRDDEADKLDTEEMLAAFKEGTEEANEFRTERGFKPIHVEGWSQAPTYDKTLRHIAWGLIVADEDGKSVNYNTRLLGREGYLSLNLVCEPETLASLRPMLSELLGSTAFSEGKRYTDFKEGNDKVAEYGLAALVMGGAAAAGKTFLKVGLLAKLFKPILALLVAGKKLVIVAAVALAAFLKNLLSKKPPSNPPSA